MPAWPDNLTLTIHAPSLFSGDGADQRSTTVVRRPGLINSVAYYPGWALTGADTNSRTLTLFNRGQAGVGTAVVAQLALTSGVNLSASVAKTITLGAAAARVVVVGDVLEWQSLHVGNGIADPGGRVVIQQTLGS